MELQSGLERGTWRRQMSLGQGRDLGELAGRLLSAFRAAACCAQIAEEFAFLVVELMHRHHHKAEPVPMLWRLKVLPETGCWGQVVFEAQRVLAIP